MNIELSMTEGNLPADDWTTILRKSVTGRSLEAYQELDATIPCQDFERQFLERLGCIEAKARQAVWRNLPTEQQSPRAHLSPIIRGINRLAMKVKDHIMEMFNGVLTLY